MFIKHEELVEYLKYLIKNNIFLKGKRNNIFKVINFQGLSIISQNIRRYKLHIEHEDNLENLIISNDEISENSDFFKKFIKWKRKNKLDNLKK